MNILLVNDDGIHAEGIQILKAEVAKFANVYLAAPLEQQSGKSQAISIRGTFLVEKMADNEYGFSGTPADCVQYGLHKFNDITFDYIFSGVNDGPNLGEDIFYSGTVGGATEAAFMGYKSVAFSCGQRNHWDNVVKGLPIILRKIFSNEISFQDSVLNVNFPPNGTEIQGVKYTFSGRRNYTVSFYEEEGSLKNVHEIEVFDTTVGSDIFETRQGFITITPLKIERTDLEYLKTAATL